MQKNKYKMVEATILKIEKLQYNCNRLNDFDEIWHDNATWWSEIYHPLVFQKFRSGCTNLS